MASLRECVESQDLKAEIRLSLRSKPGRDKIWILVEGIDDEKVYSKFFRKDRVKIKEVPGSCLMIGTVVPELNDESGQVIGIKDADFIRLHGENVLHGAIFITDQHDLEMMMLKSDRVLENIDAEYVNFEIPRIEDFMEVIEENPNLCGLNVTIPYKEQVIPYLDELDKDTAKIGAVNVIKIIRLPKGKVKLVGYNSDIIGFTQSIEPLLQPHHKKALILGTGGASKAVYRGLENLGIKSTFVSRAKKEDKYLTYEELTPEIMQEYTVIVNCTPVGMYPKVDFCPNIPYELLTPNHLLYDLLYNPNETLFMKKGQAQGAVTKNGLEMLLLQAFAAWEIWNK